MAAELLFGNSFETRFKVPDLIPFIISANEKASPSDRCLFIEKAKLSFNFFETQLKALDPVLKSQSFKISWKDEDGLSFPCLSGSELRGMILADIQMNIKKHRFHISLADKPTLFSSKSYAEITTTSQQKKPRNRGTAVTKKKQDSDDENPPQSKSSAPTSKSSTRKEVNENKKKRPQPKLKPKETSKSTEEMPVSTNQSQPTEDQIEEEEEENENAPRKKQKMVQFSIDAEIVEEEKTSITEEELPSTPSVQANLVSASSEYNPFSFLNDAEKQTLIDELEKSSWDDGIINHLVFTIGRWKSFLSTNKHLITCDYYIPGYLRNSPNMVEGVHYRKNVTLEEFIQWLRQLLNLPPKKYSRH